MSATYPVSELDPVAGASLTAHALVTEGVHGLPNVPALEALRRNAGDTGWEGFDPATQAELDAVATAKQDAATAATDAELTAHTGLTQGFHDTPTGMTAAQSFRRNGAGTAWEAFTAATPADVAASSAGAVTTAGGYTDSTVSAHAALTGNGNHLPAGGILNANVAGGAAIAYSKLALPGVSVKDYGAVGDGVTNDRAAIQAAIDACPAGGFVYLGWGNYLTSGGTLVVKGKAVTLVGAGGHSDIFSTAPFIRGASTRIVSTSNHPIIHLYEPDQGVPYAAIPSGGSSIRDIAVEGSRTAGSSQHGIWVDNRAILSRFSDIQVSGCGGHGILISDAVGAKFDNVRSSRNEGDGWRLDESFATDTTNAACTINTFTNCHGSSNAGNGMHIRVGSWGNLVLGGDVEGNTGYGLMLGGGETGSQQTRFNRTIGLWVEVNTAGSLRLETTATIDNELDFARLDVAPSAASATVLAGNHVSFCDISQTGDAQRKSWQFPVLRAGQLSGADLSHVAIRSVDDSGEGNIRARSVLSTFGLTVARDTLLSALAVPQATDAFCAPNGRGMTWRNAANSANIQGVFLDASDELQLGSGLAAGKAAVVNSVKYFKGTGSPEASVTAAVGSVYTRTDGGAGTILYLKESGAGNTGWWPVGSAQPIISNTQTGNYTAVLTDAGKAVEMNVASANTFTVPPNSSVAFSVGSVIEVYQMGAGQTTLTPGSGVTLREPDALLKTAKQYSSVTLRKRATDEWVVAGYTA